MLGSDRSSRRSGPTAATETGPCANRTASASASRSYTGTAASRSSTQTRSEVPRMSMRPSLVGRLRRRQDTAEDLSVREHRTSRPPAHPTPARRPRFAAAGPAWRGRRPRRDRAKDEASVRSAHRPLHHVPLLGGGEAPRAGGRGDVGAARPGAPRTCSRRPASGSPPLRAGDAAVQVLPSVQPGDVRVPEHRAVVGVPCRDDAAGPAHPPHLAQRPHRVADVLEHLVRVDDVEGVVGVVQRVHVADRERDVVQAAFAGRGRAPAPARRAPRRAGDARPGARVRRGPR